MPPARRRSDVALSDELEAARAQARRGVAEGADAREERPEAQAERASIKYKQVEFLSTRIGETFKGLVNAVIGRGLFVQLDENKCEGFVPKESFPWDQWAFDEDRVLFEGLRSGTKIGLGDSITIRVVAADLAKRQLEFEWLEDDKQAV